MAQKKREAFEFGTLPTNVRHAIAMHLWHNASMTHPGKRVAVEVVSMTVSYALQVENEEPVADVVPNIDPFRGYEEPSAPNDEGTHPDDDATGHNGGVTRTHEDFGPRLSRTHGPEDPYEFAEDGTLGFK